MTMIDSTGLVDSSWIERNLLITLFALVISLTYLALVNTEKVFPLRAVD